MPQLRCPVCNHLAQKPADHCPACGVAYTQEDLTGKVTWLIHQNQKLLQRVKTLETQMAEVVGLFPCRR